jgi:hypothetical protein
MWRGFTLLYKVLNMFLILFLGILLVGTGVKQRRLALSYQNDHLFSYKIGDEGKIGSAD